MTPLRLFVLAALFYLLYRLLTSGKKDQHKVGGEAENSNRIDDVLVEDPVCHTYIPKGTATSFALNGETYYFCSNDCLKKFKAEKGAEK